MSEVKAAQDSKAEVPQDDKVEASPVSKEVSQHAKTEVSEVSKIEASQDEKSIKDKITEAVSLENLKTLSEKEKDLIVESWTKFKDEVVANTEKAIETTENILTDKDGAIKAKVEEYEELCVSKSKDLQASVAVLCKQVADGVSSTVDSLKHPNDLFTVVVDSDAFKKARELGDEGFTKIKSTLIITIKGVVGEDFTKELETTWYKALDEVTDIVNKIHYTIWGGKEIEPAQAATEHVQEEKKIPEEHTEPAVNDHTEASVNNQTASSDALKPIESSAV